MSHGSDALHFSVRIDGIYVDPMTVLGCRPVDLTKALWLLPPPPGSSTGHLVPAERADHRMVLGCWCEEGDSRRDLRPGPRWSPGRGGGARHQLELDEVRFIPAGDPWQKEWREVTPAAHRTAMTRLAVEEAAGFELDERGGHGPGRHTPPTRWPSSIGLTT